MAIDLLPAEHEAPACTAFTRALGASPAGSGLALDRIVVVSVPAPWPKPALGHDALKPLVAPLTASATKTRLFAGEPAEQASTIEVYERIGVGATLTSFSIDEQLGDAERHALMVRTVEQIASTAQGELETIVGEHRTITGIDSATHDALHAPVMLVCTQGSHDNCCGVHGETFAAETEAGGLEITVRRVSHTGGHRFAPTAMSFPDGRMWAWLDQALLTRIVDDAVTSDDLATRCRGWWGVSRGEQQVAEIAARIDHGESLTHAPEISVLADAAPGTHRVSSGDRSWTVQVAVARHVPTIACETPGGLPIKQTVEYTWTITGRDIPA